TVGTLNFFEIANRSSYHLPPLSLPICFLCRRRRAAPPPLRKAGRPPPAAPPPHAAPPQPPGTTPTRAGAPAPLLSRASAPGKPPHSNPLALSPVPRPKPPERRHRPPERRRARAHHHPAPPRPLRPRR